MLELRTWVNYVDIDNMIGLKSRGFRAYIDNDLHIVLFFLCAISELVMLAILGPEESIKLAKSFYKRFIEAEVYREAIAPWPVDHRFRIYEHLKRLNNYSWPLNEKPELKKPELTFI